MTPLGRYRDGIREGQIAEDPEQLKAVQALERAHGRLAAAETSAGFRLPWFRSREPDQAQGTYIYGGVGRGKTWLMDQFYGCVASSSKTRTHFHRFMRSVHEELKAQRDTQDPLAKIGRGFARRHRLICLDEFLVTDIADAVILAGLLRAMVAEGAILVMTSNTAPDDLYLGGLQRDRFLPAISLIKSHAEVVKIGPGTDYRLRLLEGETLYHQPLGEMATAALASEYGRLTCQDVETEEPLAVLGRTIPVIKRTHDLVWFEFRDICDGPRSNLDYIEIANVYRTVMISNIPELTWEYENQARRFIELVDEFYDRGVHLIVSAAAEPDELYCGKRLTRDYERTSSRLVEMQTDRYLSRLTAG